MRRRVVWKSSYEQTGRLTPPDARSLRAGAVALDPHAVMDWHSTKAREEFLVVLSGQVVLEVGVSSKSIRRVTLHAGRCAFLPPATLHRVVNRATTQSHYLYVTAPTDAR